MHARESSEDAVGKGRSQLVPFQAHGLTLWKKIMSE